MTPTTLDAFLPSAFRSFLYEVCGIERQVRALLVENAAARADARPPAPDTLRSKLKSHLDRQAVDARAQGRDTESATFQHGRHLMAAVADAIFQSFEWWGRKLWLAEPLIGDFPAPDGVPQEIAEQIDLFLTAQDHDPELAQLFLLTLASGAFPQLETAGSRRRLLEILGEQFPELTGEPEHYFPEAYRRRQARGPASLLPSVRGWLVAALVVAGLLLAVSVPLWLTATNEVRQDVRQMLAPGD